MAWKNLKQRSLADSMLIDHDALKELDDVQSTFTAKPVPIDQDPQAAWHVKAGPDGKRQSTYGYKAHDE